MSPRPELCAKCGARLWEKPLGGARLCPRHLQEARLAGGPFACTTAAIDAGYPEDDAPRQDKGTIRAGECTRETTCALCDGPMSPGEWTARIGGRDNHTFCAGDDGWAIQ